MLVPQRSGGCQPLLHRHGPGFPGLSPMLLAQAVPVRPAFSQRHGPQRPGDRHRVRPEPHLLRERVRVEDVESSVAPAVTCMARLSRWCLTLLDPASSQLRVPLGQLSLRSQRIPRPTALSSSGAVIPLLHPVPSGFVPGVTPYVIHLLIYESYLGTSYLPTLSSSPSSKQPHAGRDLLSRFVLEPCLLIEQLAHN